MRFSVFFFLSRVVSNYTNSIHFNEMIANHLHDPLYSIISLNNYLDAIFCLKHALLCNEIDMIKESIEFES